MSSIRSPLQFKKTLSVSEPVNHAMRDGILTLTGVTELLHELYQLRTAFAEKMSTMQTLEEKVQGGWTEEVQTLKQEFNARIEDVITRLEAKTPASDLERIIANVRGEDGYTPIKGVDYTDGEAPTDEYLLGLITPLIPESIKGEDGLPGKNADEKVIVEKVLAKVRPLIPKPAVIKSIDEAALVAKVLAQLPEKKITVDDIEGLDDTVSARLDKHQQRLGYLHGGGDTVSAGSNITITNTNGTKVISSTGGGGSLLGTQEKSTTTPDGIQTTFSFAHTPRVIFWDGAMQTLTDDYTVSLLTITFTGAAGIPQTNDKIVNIYA